MYLHITLAGPFLNTIYIRVLCMQEARKNWHLGVPSVIRVFPCLFCPSDNFPVSLISCLSPHLSLCQWDVMVSPRWTPLPLLGLTLPISSLCWSLPVYFSSYFEVLFKNLFIFSNVPDCLQASVCPPVCAHSCPLPASFISASWYFFFFSRTFVTNGLIYDWYIAESSQRGFYVSTFNL